MDVQLLKTLVDLSQGEDCVDVAAFFNRFPKNQATLNSLKTLQNLGYIIVLYADDDIDEIGVNKKAFDYFK